VTFVELNFHTICFVVFSLRFVCTCNVLTCYIDWEAIKDYCDLSAFTTSQYYHEYITFNMKICCKLSNAKGTVKLALFSHTCTQFQWKNQFSSSQWNEIYGKFLYTKPVFESDTQYSISDFKLIQSITTFNSKTFCQQQRHQFYEFIPLFCMSLLN